MYLKEELNMDVLQIWLLYTKSYEYFYCLKQINKFKQSEFSDNRFISFISYTSWYILVIELCKVYQNDNKNQHYNVYKLINILKNEYKNLEYKSLLTKDDIEKYYTNFNSLQIIEIRDKLVLLRDKFYAHTDRQDERFIKQINLNLAEIEILFKALRDFIYDINNKVFSIHSVIDDVDIYIDLENVLKKIDDSNLRHRENVIKELMKNKGD
jgi:hypothetical protein